MRFASIVGARPQFIKLAPVSRALRQRHSEILIHTGQHYDNALSGTFFEELCIPAPDYNLGIGSAPHGAQTGRMLQAVEEVLVREQPDGVIVYGDTNSTLAGALAAVKLHIPVAHVEAGLRSFNRAMPEEINRILTDHVSSRLFCPTVTAERNLRNEGVEEGLLLVGDVMYDALEQMRPQLSRRAEALLSTLGITPQSYVLATIHRPSNTDDPEHLRSLVATLDDAGWPVVFPVHPRTRQAMARHGIRHSRNMLLLDPVGYLDMLVLERGAMKVVTDSGGVQREAFILRVPCITLREETEWLETLEGEWNVLVGRDRKQLIEALGSPSPDGQQRPAFGEGDAAIRIANSLDHWPPQERMV
ncbi:MAG: UDP-N-acetylglucosamine 2-epimerase (non-hydrolyzing) [Candidatus Nephthysia bennettiae]|uniref:UDP-N-acetylglucosamine 2-epimerase (Non-hydrolyzing) n=1 Tax=Candidatus Nephthysia bennettiae TaxID=3127016 RepID=A0A934KDC2_9BACT|nr:UDP-N-acetylglucosamine 2-epimerase (non-hydrolyzing) [Candidatus Dormibacteraeota bacterium]MBJ7614004.1 UDP-N-acetylglucosamine 2-epimerase (non-hydrolyzing) [Candidatus Dormibacteraeota bacterium]PZR90149.1 MAG: UDP-N-acetylglucosamine 2-epimerase (non-hydrolyzing) [Candidatus Dormibacteraeota bacterium]